ncbi:MAG: phosphatidate cytidylyltransferase [Planctomycetota bacterium]|nr:MAG: phosphatidate cytidylyltransferase [Planctomycetota bacterium]
MIRERLIGASHAFDHPVTVWITAGIGAALVVALLIIASLSATGVVKDPFRKELWKRTLAWAVMAPLLIGPVLLGAAWTIAGVAVLSLACYSEFARATGLFREKLVSAVVVLGILCVGFAAFDHWYGFFVALFPLTVIVIAAVAILPDNPKGYLQRVALGVLAFMLFGSSLAHVSYMANDWNYRPIVLMLLLGVQLNDVFAFISGKLLGRRKIVPHTSPNKTVAGHLGALVLTTPLVATIAHFIFRGTDLDRPHWLILLGVLVSVSGQMGDLMLSSIKRDLGIKDMGVMIPGHGGVLDRVNSILLAAPAVFHYVGFFVGFGLDQPTRILTGP